jgi:hypothetical protein
VDQDTLGTVVVSVVIVGFLLLLGIAGWWWRQRLRFASGADPVVACALRRPRRWGFGWRSGTLKLTAEAMLWRGYWSFRAKPQVVLRRADLRFISWTRGTLQSFLAISGGEVLHLEDSDGHLELALFPRNVELFLEWLGVQAERPPHTVPRLVWPILWLGWLGAVAIIGAALTGQPFYLLMVGVPVVAILVAGSLVTTWIRKRRALPHVMKDEFVADARETFTFLRDFGFDNVWVDWLPWSVAVLFGASDRRVRLYLDRRRERLVLDMQRRGGQPQTLRDLLADRRHPDPDRVTRYRGADGPMRAALEANAHALRLWGRPFLTDSNDGPPGLRART